MLFGLNSPRLRLTEVHEGGLRGRDNRTSIPKGTVYDARWIVIGKRSPLQRLLSQPEEVLRELQIYRNTVRIYQLVDGLAFAERKVIHIRAEYERELAGLYDRASVIRRSLDSVSSRVSANERRNLEFELYHLELRIEAIRAIIADHAARGVGLTFAFQRAQLRLVEMADNLEEMAGQVRVGRRALRWVRQITDGYCEELPYFASKDIRPKVQPVQNALNALARNPAYTHFPDGRLRFYTWPKLATNFERMAGYLREGALLLHTEALAVDPEELDAARRLLRIA
jgi:hypothetical protein